jgi:hypothetical protein
MNMQVVRKIGRLLGRLSGASGEEDEFYVSGSGLVHVPHSRLQEIPRLIQEHHQLESENARRLSLVRRGV